MGKITIVESVTPTPPAANTMLLYARNGAIYSLDPVGNDVKLTRDDLGTIAVQNANSVNITGGTIDLQTGNLVLADGQLAWVKINKSGASIADIPNRQHSLVIDDEPEKHVPTNDAITTYANLWSAAKIASEISGSGALAYVVGKAGSDPYSSIQSAVDQAVLDGVSVGAPATVLVKPGTYTESVSLVPGVNIVAVAREGTGLTRLIGSVIYTANTGGPILVPQPASWVGIDIIRTTPGSSLTVSGSEPQKLCVSDCLIANVDSTATVQSNNSDSSSSLEFKSVKFENTTGATGIVVGSGTIVLFSTKIETGSVSLQCTGSSVIESFYTRAAGQLVFDGTSSGTISNTQIDAGTNPAIVMNSTGSLLAHSTLSIGTGLLVSGTHLSNVILHPNASEIPYDNSLSGLSGQTVQQAIDELVGGSSAVIAQTEIDFYEGDNPPYIADIDVFGFQDAAGFPAGSVAEVIFKVQSNALFIASGFTISLIYAMSGDDSGNDVELRLDYVVHNSGEDYDGGTSYGQTQLLTLSSVDKELNKDSVFTIPNGHVTANTVEVEFKLSRVGTSASDTASSDFGLKHIVITP